MKRLINLALVLLVACAAQIPPNRYGLRVVPDAATYQRLVRADPDARLVDLETFIPGVVLDIRYATPNNFMHQTLYPVAKAWLRYPAAAALRGAAVDLTLVDVRTGSELAMPTPYDDFTPRARQDFNDLPADVISNRAKLRDVMTRHGFEARPSEWWHFDFKGWQRFDLMNVDPREL